MIVFFNDQFVSENQAVVSIYDRGFLLGDGLFETVRVASGRPSRLAQHWERLARGAEFLKIKPPFAAEEIQRFAARLIALNQMPEAVLRLTLTRGPGARGYSIKGANRPTLAMTLHPLPSLKSAPKWRLITSSFRVPAGDALASFKTSSKLLNVLACAEAEEQGADEALLVNTNGEATETVSGNLFWIERNQVCTVPLSCGALPGITRAAVLEICPALGLETYERVIQPEQLRQAAGIFVTQSALGVVPVVSLDGEPVTPSPLVERIAGAYEELLRRESV